MTIERLTGEAYEEDDLSGIPDLVEVIKLQDTAGATEAARAIRKKLKYGSVHRQLRALTLLDGLIQNAGPRFQRTFADETLLERLRVCGTSDLSDPDVRKKCSELFRSWASDYKNTPGLERIAKLYKVRECRVKYRTHHVSDDVRNSLAVNKSLRKRDQRSSERQRILSEKKKKKQQEPCPAPLPPECHRHLRRRPAVSNRSVT